jgi:hypothetical protein
MSSLRGKPVWKVNQEFKGQNDKIKGEKRREKEFKGLRNLMKKEMGTCGFHCF